MAQFNGNPRYRGHKVTIGLYRKRFVIVTKDGELWANEYMKTIEGAKKFCELNGLIITSEEVKPFKKKV